MKTFAATAATNTLSCKVDICGKIRPISTMYIEDCIWLPDVSVKLFVKHRVTQREVEEIFFNRPKYRFVESGFRKGEDVYSATGQTDAGRYLIVFFIQKQNNLALILSARDMDRKERRRHESQ